MTGEKAGARYLALSGGIGGAKLALGLARALADPSALTVVANTGDDFTHLGLRICPDIDTLTYTLAGLADDERGWGRANETFHALETLRSLGAEAWFTLGDKDLGLHIERTRRLATGESLSAITADVCAEWRVGPRVLPMTDEPAPTLIKTERGVLEFQHYFVRERCEPCVTGFVYGGADVAPHPAVLRLLADPALEAVVICPSNPLISVEPILALPGVREALAATAAPVVAVSPLVGGAAIKGPTAKMMAELGETPSTAAVAARYGEFLDGFVLDAADERDAPAIAALAITPRAAATVMRSLDDRIALARAVLAFARDLAERPSESAE